jgi:hypothetical protein
MYTMDEEIIEIYKEYRIEINQVPECQFDFDDFGWAFQVSKNDSRCFQLIIKTAASIGDEVNKNRVRNWGLDKVRALIDTEDFKIGANYCYKWEYVPNTPSPKEVDCEGFLLKV